MRTAAWALGALIASALTVTMLITALGRQGAWAIAAGLGVALVLGRWAGRMWWRAWGEWVAR
jgi:hypothetical protein